MVIRENELYKRVASIVGTALSSLGISGFDVLQQHQPTLTSDHSCVLITRVDVHRYGWQGVEYEKPAQKLVPSPWGKTDAGAEADFPQGYDATVRERWNYIDEATFQVSSYRPRKVDDTVSSLTAHDVVSAIATWAMSPAGIKEMYSNGLKPLRISDVRNPVGMDDSEFPQFNPNFDIRFLVVQQSGMRVPVIWSVGRDAELMDGRHMI